MNTQKKNASILSHIVATTFFSLLTLVYFYPAFGGMILQQDDLTNFEGMAQEAIRYKNLTGWTGSMFSGMPTYHITGYSTSFDFIGYMKEHVFDAFQGETAGPIFFLLITSYILFLTLETPIWLATLGAVATAFSSYNFIIIAAGHITKAWTLAFVPLLLSGLCLIFKKKYIVGFVTFSFGLVLMFVSNHLQITYYTALFCLILFIGFAIEQILRRKYKHLGITIGLLTTGVVLAGLANANNLYLNYESGQSSIRGRTELTPLQDNSDTVQSTANGLNKNYVFEWSYSKIETLSILIPNIMGGKSSGSLGYNSHLYKTLSEHGIQPNKEVQTYTYWGDKPFTSGPIYFGAVICFLSLLSLFITQGRLKWWLLGSTVFFIFLAWGRHLAWFNDWMYYYFPLYNKFRTVEMALIIPGFTFPIMAMLAVKELVKLDMINQVRNDMLQKGLLWSAGITGGICLFFWIMPDVFLNFESTYDSQLQYQLPNWYYFALLADRKSLLQADALRSFAFIILSTGLIFLYIQSENKKQYVSYMIAGLTLLTICDLWSIDKRYLNHNNFISKQKHKELFFKKTKADEIILQDPNPSYRVLNLNNPFNESRTSYYHKSIGGYHAAKLRRYQDLIDRRLIKEIQTIIAAFQKANTLQDVTTVLANCQTLNMLNVKYIIYNPKQPPLINPFAYDNAWFVNSYRFTNTPDEEMEALETLNPKTEAVVDKQFNSNLAGLAIVSDTMASIKMTVYTPPYIEYQSESSKEGLAVFSEIYYKNGWKAYIDGKSVPISRANWILRSIIVPAGKHHIEFVFDPDNVRIAGSITTIFSGLLLLLIIGSLGFYICKK